MLSEGNGELKVNWDICRAKVQWHGCRKAKWFGVHFIWSYSVLVQCIRFMNKLFWVGSSTGNNCQTKVPGQLFQLKNTYTKTEQHKTKNGTKHWEVGDMNLRQSRHGTCTRSSSFFLAHVPSEVRLKSLSRWRYMYKLVTVYNDNALDHSCVSNQKTSWPQENPLEHLCSF